MNRAEHLFTKLVEECCEVGQRATKAMRFGPEEVWQDPVGNPEGLTNAELILSEMFDVFAVLELLSEDGLLPSDFDKDYDETLRERKAKVEAMLKFSQTKGTLQ